MQFYLFAAVVMKIIRFLRYVCIVNREWFNWESHRHHTHLERHFSIVKYGKTITVNHLWEFSTWKLLLKRRMNRNMEQFFSLAKYQAIKERIQWHSTASFCSLHTRFSMFTGTELNPWACHQRVEFCHVELN